LIRDMSPGAIRNAYVLYIGAGAVAAGGIISVIRSLPTIWHGLREGLRDVSNSTAATVRDTVRTDRDLSITLVLLGIIALLVALVGASPLYVGGTGFGTRIAAALLIVVFGFLFVTVSSRLTGEIGSSSNPISGMTVATLLLFTYKPHTTHNSCLLTLVRSPSPVLRSPPGLTFTSASVATACTSCWYNSKEDLHGNSSTLDRSSRIRDAAAVCFSVRPRRPTGQWPRCRWC
jgi:uncharacterized oligopeptide transporter (OPT) family protein